MRLEDKLTSFGLGSGSMKYSMLSSFFYSFRSHDWYENSDLFDMVDNIFVDLITTIPSSKANKLVQYTMGWYRENIVQEFQIKNSNYCQLLHLAVKVEIQQINSKSDNFHVRKEEVNQVREKYDIFLCLFFMKQATWNWSVLEVLSVIKIKSSENLIPFVTY